MSADSARKVYGELKETGEVRTIDGIRCDVVKLHFPAGGSGGKWRWYDAYRFTAPGWDECTIVGLAEAKRVIRGRTDMAVLNTLGKNPYANIKSKQPQPVTQEVENTGCVSVIQAIREHRDAAFQPKARTEHGSKAKLSEHEI